MTEALEVLITCVTHNPGSTDLHFDIANIQLRELEFEDDVSKRVNILHHLKKSIQKGDKRYDRRFWLARELFLHNEVSEARSMFDSLGAAPIPFRLKKETKAVVKISETESRRYSGKVANIGDTFVFLRSPEFARDIYASIDEFPTGRTTEGATVSFSLAFSMFGPVAVEIQPVL